MSEVYVLVLVFPGVGHEVIVRRRGVEGGQARNQLEMCRQEGEAGSLLHYLRHSDK